MDNIKIYQTKYLVSGNILEQFVYEHDQFKGFKAKNKSGKNRNGVFSDFNKKNVLSRARKKIIRLINANPDLNKFLTLTFKENITDLDIANYEFKKFINRINYHFFNTKKRLFKYVAVIEFQDGKSYLDSDGILQNGLARGVIHYHIICNMPYLSLYELNLLAEKWGHGFIRINKIKGSDNDDISIDCDNVGAYVTKYMTKDNGDSRLKERKSYLFSRNLNKPIEIFINYDEVDYIEKQYNLPEPVNAYFSDSSDYSYSYSSEYTGAVIVNQYNLKRRLSFK